MIMFIRIIYLPLLLLTISAAQEQQQVIFLHTTDVHGNIYPYDYFNDRPAENGLAKIYTLVKRFRQK